MDFMVERNQTHSTGHPGGGAVSPRGCSMQTACDFLQCSHMFISLRYFLYTVASQESILSERSGRIIAADSLSLPGTVEKQWGFFFFFWSPWGGDRCKHILQSRCYYCAVCWLAPIRSRRASDLLGSLCKLYLMEMLKSGSYWSNKRLCVYQ